MQIKRCLRSFLFFVSFGNFSLHDWDHSLGRCGKKDKIPYAFACSLEFESARCKEECANSREGVFSFVPSRAPKRTDWWDSLKSRSVCIICSLSRHRQGASANWTGKSLYCKTHANANEIREDQVRAKSSLCAALLLCGVRSQCSLLDVCRLVIILFSNARHTFSLSK